MIMEIIKRFQRWGVTGQTVLCLTFSSVFAGASIAQPTLLSRLIDDSQGTGDSIEEQAIALLAAVVLATTFNALLIRQEGRLIARIRACLQKELILTVSTNWATQRHGRGLQVFVGDTDTVSNYVVGIISKLLPGLGMFLFAFVALLRIDVILTLCVLVIGVSFSALTVPFLRRMARAERDTIESRDELSDTLLTYFSVAYVASRNGKLGYLNTLVTQALNKLEGSSRRSANVQAQFAPFNNSVVPIVAVSTDRKSVV